MIIEAPDTNRKRDTRVALARFAEWAGLRIHAVETGFVNDTQQEIALMYDPNVISAAHDPIEDEGAAQTLFTEHQEVNLAREGKDLENAHFSKPPLELACRHIDTGRVFRMIGCHVKSKAPHGATTPEEVRAISLENRRKQLAQAVWLRERVAWHLGRDEALVVLGDFNDGAGLDEYEAVLGRSGLEVIMGREDPKAAKPLRLFDPHAGPQATATSARFYIKQHKRFLTVMIDYTMLSQSLRGRWRVWNPFEDNALAKDTELRDALVDASDHFPVSVDIAL